MRLPRKVLLHGTSLAVLTYIGFDGISTLSEEVHNPKRNILLATVLVCVITGILASAEVYSAQLLRPGYGYSAAEAERAFAHVAAIAGGAAISFAITITLLIATIGSGMGAQLGAARLLYGMGRSNAIPKSFFGAIDPRTRIPRNNVIVVGVVALVGAYIIRDYDRAAELLNLRRPHRLHGRQYRLAHSLLHSRSQSIALEPSGSAVRVPHLRGPVAPSVEDGSDRRHDLDARGRRLWGLQDPRLPGGPGELRCAE